MTDTTINRGNFSYKVPDEVVRKQFIATIPANEGANVKNTLDTFLLVADDITKTARSFTFDDFLVRARVYGLEVSEVKNYFGKWIQTLTDLHRVETIRGCYDSDVFLNI